MPVLDASFDVVVANLAIHNIESDEEREQAIQEIRRVLIPEGRIAIMDIFHVEQIASQARQSGLKMCKYLFLFFFTMPF